MISARSYRISELLGRGSFGAVYLADTVGTGIRRPVAIKVLRPEQAAIPGLLERLRDEARMLSMIRHRAIVRVDDLVELDGHWSIVMEYIEGCDVASFLQEGPLPPRVALAIAEEVANALHVAATQEGPDGTPLRLVHRDVKPGNIRVTAQGEVKLLDFGVARADFAARESSGTAGVFGTPTYMAPERYRGEDTHAGDVYALGVTLFEMLAGEPPGLGPMEPERVPPGLRLAPAWRQIRDTSVHLRDLVAVMLAPNPQDRPPARECARALGRIRGQIGGMTIEDWSERVVPPALKRKAALADGRIGTVMLERRSQPSLNVPNKKKPSSFAAWLAAGGLAMVGGGVAIVAVLGVGGWWWTHRAPTVVQAPPVEVPTLVEAPPSTEPAPVVEPPSAPPEPPITVEPAVPATPPVATTPPATSVTTTPTTPVAPTPTSTTKPASKPPANVGSHTGANSPADTPTPRPTTTSTRTQSGTPTVPGGSSVKTGIVALEGPADAAILMGKAGVYGPGELPVGDYTVEVTLSSGEVYTLRGFTVRPGNVTRIVCDTRICREVEEM